MPAAVSTSTSSKGGLKSPTPPAFSRNTEIENFQAALEKVLNAERSFYSQGFLEKPFGRSTPTKLLKAAAVFKRVFLEKDYSAVTPEIAEGVALLALEHLYGSQLERMTEYFSSQAFQAKGLRAFDDEAAKLLLSETAAIELTKGCSVGCAFCGLGAKYNSKPESLSFSDIVKIFALGRDHLAQNEAFLYYRTDPFDYQYPNDWSERTLTYPDIHALAKRLAGVFAYVSTAVPRGKEELVGQNLRIVDRISISDMNRERLAKYIATWTNSEHAPYVDFYDVSINPRLNSRLNGRDQLFGKSITDFTRQTGIGCINGVLLGAADNVFNYVQIPETKNPNFFDLQLNQPIDAARLKLELPKSATEIADFLKLCQKEITVDSIPVIGAAQAVLSAGAVQARRIRSDYNKNDKDGNYYVLVHVKNLVSEATYRIFPDCAQWGKIEVETQSI